MNEAFPASPAKFQKATHNGLIQRNMFSQKFCKVSEMLEGSKLAGEEASAEWHQ